MKLLEGSIAGRGLVCFLILIIGSCFPGTVVYSDITAGSGIQNVDTSKQPLPGTGNVTVNFKEVDIKTVLHYLSEVSGIDIVPSPEVSGTVTMRLRDKPWEVALDVVTRNRGYVYSRDDEQGIIRVMPKSKLEDEEPISEVIPLNYIHAYNMDNQLVLTENVGVESLLEAVNKILADGETATYVPDSNALVITAIPARIQAVKKLVYKLDKKTPQIILEAKVIEVELDQDDQFGIDWNMVISAAGARRPTTFPFTNSGLLPLLPGGGQRRYLPNQSSGDFNDTAFPMINAATLFDPTAMATSGALFAYGTLDFSQFTAVLRMIENRDDTNIVSSPRITTLNNQPSVIKVINNIYLQKQVKTTDTATLVTVEFEKEPRETGVILEVIPHVNENNEITVDLRPQVSTTPRFQELQVNGVQNTVAMTFNSREADTQVMVKDGETIFIGGLIYETKSKREHKVPILGDLLGWIPVVGSAVNYEEDMVDKTEVVFFVTVNLINSGIDSIKKSETQNVFRRHYPGKSEKEPLKQGKLTATQTSVQIPVDARPVEKKKAWWDFSGKK